MEAGFGGQSDAMLLLLKSAVPIKIVRSKSKPVIHKGNTPSPWMQYRLVVCTIGIIDHIIDQKNPSRQPQCLITVTL